MNRVAKHSIVLLFIFAAYTTCHSAGPQVPSTIATANITQVTGTPNKYGMKLEERSLKYFSPNDTGGGYSNLLRFRRLRIKENGKFVPTRVPYSLKLTMNNKEFLGRTAQGIPVTNEIMKKVYSLPKQDGKKPKVNLHLHLYDNDQGQYKLYEAFTDPNTGMTEGKLVGGFDLKLIEEPTPTGSSTSTELKSVNTKRIIFKNVKSPSTRSLPISSTTSRNKDGQSTIVSFNLSDYNSGRKIKVNIIGDSISTNGDNYFVSMAPWFDSGEEKGYQKADLVGVTTGFSGPPHTDYALPKDISNALKKNDQVYVNVTAFPTTNGTYKAQNFPFSFTLSLADQEKSVNEKSTTTPSMVGGPGSWSPGIKKDFHFFKEKVTKEIESLKKMINHLMEKMNK